MIIKKVKLENIKSYINEEIELRPGINFILGLNGSGKSTIIEAIGFALFNYTKGNISKLLRYNEKKGLVRVEFVANDDKAYAVERVIRSSGGSVKIIDLKTSTELYSGVSDVYSFIKKVLRIKNTKDFADMFAEIIAVPQGNYVSAFLEKPAIRKTNFDRLLNLHIYKDIGYKIKSLYDNIKLNYIDSLTQEIALIDGKVDRYDEKLAKEKLVIKEIEAIEKKIKEKNAKLKLVITEKKALEVLKDEINELNKKQEIYQERIKNASLRIEDASREIENAKKAKKIVEETQDDYNIYNQYQEKQVILENKHREFLNLEERIKTITNEVKIINNNIKNTDSKIEEKNIELDKLKNERLGYDRKVVVLNNNLESLTAKYEVKRQNLAKSEKQVNNKKEKIIEKIDFIKQINAEYQSLDIIDQEKYTEIEEEIKKLKAKLEEFEQEKCKIKELKEKEISLETRLNDALQYSQISYDGNCPFFKTKCKNIGEISLNQFFGDIIADSNKKLDKIIKEKAILKANLDDENGVVVKIQSLENRLSNVKANYDKIELLLEKLKEEFAISSDEKINVLLENLLKEYNDQLDELKKDEEKLKASNLELINEKTDLNTLNFEINTTKINIENTEAKLKGVKAYLDIQRKHNGVLTSKKANLISEKMGLELKSKEVDVKAELDLVKASLKELEPNRELYIANINKAKELEELILNLEKDKENKADFEEKASSLNNEVKTLEKKFSLKALQKVSESEKVLDKEISSLDTLETEKQKAKLELAKEISEMENLIKERSKKQKEMNKYNNIISFLINMRAIYTNLPLKLSERYREYIANAATQLYRQISMENVKLELTDDYEVRMIDGVKKENFKTIDQLSGGEQMSVAIAIRLSMLKHLAGVDIYFLDEPTINLDELRREKIADVVQDIATELTQLFVISHDDTFDNITDNVIKLEKINNISKKI